jgi:hypothetical protein
LEQVHVKCIVCRGLRLKLVAGLGIALAMPALAIAAQNAPRLATQTTLAVETHDSNGRTQAKLAVTVTGEDGLPASGAVAISDHGSQVSGAALNSAGEANLVIDLPAGEHSLTASYTGDLAHRASVSMSAGAEGQASSTPNFAVSIAPATLSLKAGQSGTLIASVTPSNSATLTAPMFVTLSCSGLPDQSACTFTPENVEILPNGAAAIPSTVVIATQAASQGAASLTAHPVANPIAWAFLLPGALALGGLAWGTRRRAWLNRLSLLALVGLVLSLGTTACAPRYNYYNHGPPANPATPAGTYTVTVTAQSSNGITAITNNATLALTVTP